MNELSVREISITRGASGIVRGASMNLKSGELVVLLGPNGAGKTSLLRAALGLIEADGGEAKLDGVDVTTLSPSERARRISYLPQARPLTWPACVRDVVALGRFAHGAPPGRLVGVDAEAVDEVMQSCGLADLADRSTATLSGGELARVHFARAFAARTPLLIADEPVAALDPLHQHQILRLLRAYVDDGGGALCVLHDINLAAQYADRLVWMKAGEIVADGSVRETVTPERLAEIYGVDAKVTDHGAGLSVAISGPA